jgi:osmoprotectant transport system permease protein
LRNIGLIVAQRLAILLGLALGVLLSRPSLRRIAEPIIQVLNIGATIPTLAILALAMMVLGIGRAPALFALFLHALLPIVRNTYQGILGVPPHLLETARGMGMRAGQQLLWVEFPNALLTILTGIRVALVINVGIAPLAFLVGGGVLVTDLLRNRPVRAKDDAGRRHPDGTARGPGGFRDDAPHRGYNSPRCPAPDGSGAAISLTPPATSIRIT